MSYNLFTHASGLTVALMPEDNPVIHAGFAIRCGTRDETTKEYGLAHFVEHMLFKGTQMRSSRHIIQRIEEVGAELNAYTTKEETFVYASFAREHLNRVLVLLIDMVQNSSFPEEELEKEKTVIIDEIDSYADSPADLIFDEVENKLFHNTPLGHSILGTKASVARATKKSCQRFFKRYYRSDNMLFFLRGNVRYDDIESLLNYTFGTHLPTEALPIRKPVILPPIIPHTVHKRNTFQHHVAMVFPAYSLHQSERIPLSLLVNLLGGPGMNSRLNMSLRERHGLVYTIEASYTAWSDAGMVSIYYGGSKKQFGRAMSLVEAELELLMTKEIGEEELRSAKRQLKGQILLSADSRDSSTLAFARSIFHHGRYDSLEEISKRIDAITSDKMLSIAGEIFAPERRVQLIYK